MDIIEVGKNGVTAIETVEDTPHICVTVAKNGASSQYAFREWVTGTVAAAEQLPGCLTCEQCGKAFETSQGLAGHKRFCKAATE
jgi:hypothetical protein